MSFVLLRPFWLLCGCTFWWELICCCCPSFFLPLDEKRRHRRWISIWLETLNLARMVDVLGCLCSRSICCWVLLPFLVNDSSYGQSTYRSRVSSWNLFLTALRFDVTSYSKKRWEHDGTCCYVSSRQRLDLFRTTKLILPVDMHLQSGITHKRLSIKTVFSVGVITCERSIYSKKRRRKKLVGDNGNGNGNKGREQGTQRFTFGIVINQLLVDRYRF